MVDGHDNGVAFRRRSGDHPSPHKITRTGPQVEPPCADVWGMVLTQPGSAAGGAVDAPRRPEPVIPQSTDPDDLLEAVRSGLVPGDPVALLLAGWVAPPARPVCAAHVRPGGTPLG